MGLDECGNGGNLTHKKACFIFIGWIQAWYDFTLDIKSDNTNLQITKGMLNSFSFDIISHHKSCWLHKFTVLFLLQTKQILIFIQNKWFWMYSKLNSFFKRFFLISKGLLLRLDSSWKYAVTHSKQDWSDFR